MVIGIDARVLQGGEGGIFVYAKNIIERIVFAAREHQIKIFLNQSKNERLKTIESASRLPGVKVFRYSFPNKFLNASFKFANWPAIENLVQGCDVLFFPTMMYGVRGLKAKSVLTMHDISYEFFPECFTLKQRLWHSLMEPKTMCQQVSKIISVSESTKFDVSEFYGIEKSKIKVIYSGVDERFHPIKDSFALGFIKNKYRLPEGNYIIQTSTIEPRKNHIATIEAFCSWFFKNPTQSKTWRLLLVGHRGWKSKEVLKTAKSSMLLDKIRILEDVPENDLPALYSLSSIFIYPSFYEGFGFPPLEAMSCGIPVIASANSSLAEIVGDAGVLVNPYRIEEIELAINSIASDSDFAKFLSKKGIQRASKFSWDSCASETLKAIISA